MLQAFHLIWLLKNKLNQYSILYIHTKHSTQAQQMLMKSTWMQSHQSISQPFLMQIRTHRDYQVFLNISLPCLSLSPSSTNWEGCLLLFPNVRFLSSLTWPGAGAMRNRAQTVHEKQICVQKLMFMQQRAEDGVYIPSSQTLSLLFSLP